MKTLFVSDIKFLNTNDKYYTIGSFNYEKISEYIKYFDEIRMFTRIRKMDQVDLNEVKIVSGEKISFTGIETNGILKLLSLDTYKKLKEEIINSDSAIVRLPSFLGIIACSILNKLKIPYIVEVVGCPLDTMLNYGNLRSKLIAPFYYYFTKKAIKNAKYVHYVSEHFLQKRYPTFSNSLACSDVIVKNFSEDILNNKIKRINLNKDKFIIGVVGSMDVDYKGHEICIRALAEIKNTINFELHFLGEGNNLRWVKLAKKLGIEERMFFDKTLPSGEKVFNWLDGLDLHLIMSKSEGLPRILIESMNRASVCIGSNVGGIPELLTSNAIVQKYNYKELKNKILEVLFSKELQIEFAKTNFEKSKEFSIENLEKIKKDFYNKFLNDK